MWLPAERLRLSRAQRLELTSLARDPRTPKRVAARALIVLGAGGGASNRQLAQTLAVSRPTVIHWRRRFDSSKARITSPPMSRFPRRAMWTRTITSWRFAC